MTDKVGKLDREASGVISTIIGARTSSSCRDSTGVDINPLCLTRESSQASHPSKIFLPTEPNPGNVLCPHETAHLSTSSLFGKSNPITSNHHHLAECKDVDRAKLLLIACAFVEDLSEVASRHALHQTTSNQSTRLQCPSTRPSDNNSF